MQRSVRALMCRTTVQTVSGQRVGWLCDIELDLDRGVVTHIGVSPYWIIRRAKHWIQKEAIVRWEGRRVIVKDAWIGHVRFAKLPVNASSAQPVSCWYGEQSS